jgi:hypothetical protein
LSYVWKWSRRGLIVPSLLRKSLHNTLSPNVTMLSYVQVHVARITEAVLERLGIPEQVGE